MKRIGFVSNSSSSSFVIQKKDLHPLQLVAIRNHSQVAEWFNMVHYSSDAWAIEEDDFEIRGHTFMDNFRMFEFFEKIGITKVEKEDSW
jgi:hypothetical protein